MRRNTLRYCALRAVGVRLRTNLLKSFGARRVRAQARSYRGQWNGSVPSAFARKRAPTAGSRAARCTPYSRCRSPLADEPSRAYRIVHTQNAPTAEPQDAPCPSVFARKRAPTAGFDIAGCPVHTELAL